MNLGSQVMKALIISGIPFRSDTNSGKTLQTLFSKFNKEELCQLYFSPDIPNLDMCNSYYQICEKQMIKSGFGFIKKNCGGEVSPIKDNKKRIENPGCLSKNKDDILIRIGREFIWSFSKWRNRRFKDWLHRENPDVIFTIMHDVNHATAAVRWIADYLKIPVILYITDDYYNDFNASFNILRALYFRRRKVLNKELAKYCNYLIGISETASVYFSKELGIKQYATIYTPSSELCTKLPLHRQSDNNLRIRYFGNLSLQRWEVLRKLGIELSKNNNSSNIKAILEVYSNCNDSQIIKSLTIDNGCIFKGWTCGDEYFSLLQSADIVVHVESFNPSMIKRTWASVSTKIADYLGAGKCILAIGPSSIASIVYLKDLACVVSNIDELDVDLHNIIKNLNYRNELQLKARDKSSLNHNIIHNGLLLRNILTDVSR